MVYGILIEEFVHCLLTPTDQWEAADLKCPRHRSHKLSAPDLIFEDVGANFTIGAQRVVLERFLGRGAFGSVFAGSIYTDGKETSVLDLAKVGETWLDGRLTRCLNSDLLIG